jgi:hypothetical protein
MAEKKDPVAGMSKAQILKEFSPKIIRQFGEDELKFIKDESSGPGGVDRLRSYVRDYFYAKGGSVTKKKMMRGGGMLKAAGKKKMMRGGVAKKKMRGGGMAKMAAKKKMMRGGMAKKKK